MAYVFDPETLHAAAMAGVGLAHPEIFTAISSELENRYPGLIEPPNEWLFNNAGGAMGMMAILYASATEYLMFFGSPVGTAGHSGRYHFVEDYAFVIDGEFWYAVEGSTSREVYRPGDVAHLRRGEARHYRIPENGWILEYARGWIPTMLPFGLVETFSSTLDWRLAFRTLAIYSKHVTRSLRRKIQGELDLDSHR